MDYIVCGAGLSGVAMGYHLKKQLNSTSFAIFDKQSSVGGTWALNTYPNLSCDVPSELYSFSFHQKPDWTHTFASQPEILAYIKQCVADFGLEPHLRLQHECVSARWDPTERHWVADFIDLQSGKKIRITGRFLIAAMGITSVPKGICDIPALKDFSGPIFHTSDWREIDWHSKKVVVVGNGCSANQVIPWVLKEGKASQLVQLVRSDQWVLPKENPEVPTFWKWVYKFVPLVMRIKRLITAWKMDQGFVNFEISERGNIARAKTSTSLRAFMQEKSRPGYLDLLLPSHEWGTKRPVLDHGYLDATNDERFSLVKSETVRRVIDGRQIEDSAGNTHEADVVILANGWKTQQLLSPVKVYGRDNEELSDLWERVGGQEAYMGVAVHSFPNFFIVGGPNTLPAFHSTLHGLECSVLYIVRLLRALGTESLFNCSKSHSTIEIKLGAQQAYAQLIHEKMKQLIYSQAVPTYFVNEKSGKNTLSWPGSQREFWWTRCMQRIKWEDWAIR